MPEGNRRERHSCRRAPSCLVKFIPDLTVPAVADLRGVGNLEETQKLATIMNADSCKRFRLASPGIT